MPRYFFDLTHEQVLRDHEGEVHASDEEALTYAKRVATKLRGEYDGCVIVRDERGRTLGKVDITESGSVSETRAAMAR